MTLLLSPILPNRPPVWLKGLVTGNDRLLLKGKRGAVTRKGDRFLFIEMTYQQIHEAVLRYVKRPKAEVGQDVALAINNAVDYLQRKIKIKALAYTVMHDNLEVIDGQVIVPLTLFRSVDEVLVATDSEKPLTPVRMVTGAQEHNLREVAYRLTPATVKPQRLTKMLDNWLVRTNNIFGFVQGDNIIIRPLQQKKTSVLVKGTLYIQPGIYQNNELSGNNVLSTYCAEYIIYKALLDMELFLKNDVRFQTLMTYVSFLYDSVEQWNQTYTDHTQTYLS
jgi:hypothetical protein